MNQVKTALWIAHDSGLICLVLVQSADPLGPSDLTTELEPVTSGQQLALDSSSGAKERRVPVPSTAETFCVGSQGGVMGPVVCRSPAV